MRFELMTSSLPRRCSTPELRGLLVLKKSPKLSGKRGSNPRPLAWKANALPIELFPLNQGTDSHQILAVADDGFEPP